MRIPILITSLVAAMLGSAAVAQERFWEAEGKIENTAPANKPTVGKDGQLYPGLLRQDEPIFDAKMRADWEALRARPTPRINGKPDLTGHWNEVIALIKGYPEEGAFGGQQKGPNGEVILLFAARGSTILTMENDAYLWRRGDTNQPLYKPEYWAKIRSLDANALQRDDQYHCRPLGVPRMGRPNFVLQNADVLTFLYRAAYEAPTDQYRFIRINQPHDQQRIDDYTPYGESVATWDGDTLVVDTKGLSDETWLWADGLLHSTETRVIERFTRVGDTVAYDVTIEDPTVLQKPWVKPTRYYEIVDDPKITLPRSGFCEDRNAANVPGGTVH